jgi:hypothetical protein
MIRERASMSHYTYIACLVDVLKPLQAPQTFELKN